jgi:hypothetical protein
MGTNNDGGASQSPQERSNKERFQQAAKKMVQMWNRLTNLDDVSNMNWLFMTYQLATRGTDYLDALDSREQMRVRRAFGLDSNDHIAQLEGVVAREVVGSILKRIKEMVRECYDYHELCEWYTSVQAIEGMTTEEVGLDDQFPRLFEGIDWQDPPLWLVEQMEAGLWGVTPPAFALRILYAATVHGGDAT